MFCNNVLFQKKSKRTKKHTKVNMTYGIFSVSVSVSNFKSVSSPNFFKNWVLRVQCTLIRRFNTYGCKFYLFYLNNNVGIRFYEDIYDDIFITELYLYFLFLMQQYFTAMLQQNKGLDWAKTVKYAQYLTHSFKTLVFQYMRVPHALQYLGYECQLCFFQPVLLKLLDNRGRKLYQIFKDQLINAEPVFITNINLLKKNDDNLLRLTKYKHLIELAKKKLPV